MMPLDHLIVFVEKGGKVAEKLIDFGLYEGSRNVHPGQGTANRRFFFHNSFLELVWVENEEEIKGNLVAPIRLWERANHQKTGYAPFGLCIREEPDQPSVFQGALSYQPPYLPQGMHIDVITHEECPVFPMLFKIPFGKIPADLPAHESQPLVHRIELRAITKVTFGIPACDCSSEAMRLLQREPWFEIREMDHHMVLLEFDHCQRQKKVSFEPFLPLIFRY